VRGLIREVSKEIICYKKVSCKSGFDPSFQALNLNRVSITISGIPRLEPNLAQHVQPIIKLSPDQSSRYPLQYSSPRRLPRYLLSFFFLRKKKLKGIQGKAKGRAN
jgi:hypothetical protein